MNNYTLHEEVYNKTLWADTGFSLCYEWDVNGYKTGEKAIEHSSLIEMEDQEDKVLHPIYTSDYLQKKLPPVIQDFDMKFKLLTIHLNGNGTVGMAYIEPYDQEFRGSYIVNADSLVEGFLKMTLRLQQDGKLE